MCTSCWKILKFGANAKHTFIHVHEVEKTLASCINLLLDWLTLIPNDNMFTQFRETCLALQIYNDRQITFSKEVRAWVEEGFRYHRRTSNVIFWSLLVEIIIELGQTLVGLDKVLGTLTDKQLIVHYSYPLFIQPLGENIFLWNYGFYLTEELLLLPGALVLVKHSFCTIVLRLLCNKMPESPFDCSDCSY